MNTPEFLHLHLESVGEVCVVQILTEDFRSQSAIASVSNELLRLAETETERNVLLDFSAVTLVSSMMLGRLIQLQNQLTAGDGRLVLCNLQARVYQVFALTRLTKKFDIKTDRTQGLAAFWVAGREDSSGGSNEIPQSGRAAGAAERPGSPTSRAFH